MFTEETMNTLKNEVGGEEVPIEVNEPSVIGDLSDLKDSRAVVPTTSNVKLKIDKVSIQVSDDKAVEKLNVLWSVVDGIPVGDTMRFKGFKFFQGGEYTKDSIFTKINTETKNTDWWKDKKRFLNLKNLLVACELPIDNVVVNDDLLEQLKGKVVLGNVYQHAKQKINENGEYVNTGEFDNAVRYFKVLPLDQRI